MNKDQLIHLIRTQTEDTNKDKYFMSVDDMDSFIKEAEREAAERAGLFKIDSTISIVANKATYDLDEVIYLDRVKLSGEARPLLKTTKRELDFELGAWDAQVAATPKFYFRVDDTITLYPTPNAVGTVLLDGTRYPYYDLETPDNLREFLAYWVMYRFYSIEDADMSDPAKAQFFEDKFSKVFGKKKSEKFNQAWNNGTPYSPIYQTPFA